MSDPDSKALYDECGEINDENDPVLADPNRDWSEYWRILFAKVTVEDIKKFEKQYRESDEEKADLKKAYLDGEGDMDQILDTGQFVLHRREQGKYATTYNQPSSSIFCNQMHIWLEHPSNVFIQLSS